MHAHTRQDFRFVERLGDVIDATHPETLETRGEIRRRGQENHRNFGGARVGFETSTHGETIGTHHVDVQQDESRIEHHGLAIPLLSISRDAEPQVAQGHQLEQQTKVGDRIVDHQYVDA